MADLRVRFLDVEFKNPIVAASAEPTSDLQNLKRVVESGVGGFVMKTMTDSEAMRNLSYQTRWRFLDENHRICRGKIPRLFTFYGRTGLEIREPKEWLKEIKEVKKLAESEGCIIIGSIASTDVKGWVDLARMCEDAGIRMVELNFGCPHPSQMEGTKTGMLVGQDRELAGEIVKAVSSAVSAKLIIKLTPQVADVVEMARTVVDAGASAVTLTNRFVGFLVDIEKAEPYIYGTAGVGGPWVKPLTLRWIYQVYRDIGVPITGSNGVYDARDVVEFMMTGATLVQMCSVIMAEGYKWFTKTIKDLNAILDQYGYKNVGQVIGIAAKKAISYADMGKLPKERAVVDEDLCTGCKRCVTSCFYNAIQVKDKKVFIENCWGCGICTCVCPEGAIRLVYS
jgi:dihydroorotate dehydrogenase (fumarate)/dihydropyrimidine dehydrogenase (NAD+) subunit PreA